MAEWNIRELTGAKESYLIGMRRELHQHPELSGREFETSKRVRRELDAMGIPYQLVGETGVIGRIEGGPGKRVAIRADMDALPVEERTGLPFASENPGVMHACGHDAHTAVLLATGKCLSEIRDRLCGTVYLCFQSAEETGDGAEEMVAALHELGGVDLVFGFHVFGGAPVGVLAIQPGPVLAGVAEWDVRVHGRGGHGSMPETAVNPLLPAANIAQQLAAIPVNRHPAQEVCVVSPCMLTCGTAHNIIAPEAAIAGTMRYFRLEDQELLFQLICDISQNTAAAYGATATATAQQQPTPPVINDAAAVTFARETLAGLGRLKVLDPVKPAMGSDNFSVFLRDFPGFYCFAGVMSSRPGAAKNQHDPAFDVEESALLPVLEFFVAHCTRFLGLNA